MERVARYTSLVLAEQAAMRLREEGIDAQVVGHMVRDFYISLDRRPYEVMIAHKSDADAAKAIVASMHAEDAPMPVIEEGAWRPDLSGLDPEAFPVHCPACGAPLPLDAGLGHCPVCGEPVDVVDLIADRYGPEAFDALEQQHDAHEEDGAVTVAHDARCATCNASLRGLPFSGRCPSCGSLYAIDPTP